MHFCVQVLDSKPWETTHESSLRLASGIIETISLLPIRAVAINVHVVILAAVGRAVLENGTGDVTTVCKCGCAARAAVVKGVGADDFGAFSGLLS